ncbi:hypothetical protein Cob_v003031 [Colletotrichum orbiculare MAFF 240422]|uniref:Uncharacterized protein n=1 Tax=Colletotrichum orbiculare (strain 104-T / ATCC 96160 / CBS 514.97 / LARS 414 / MAFF 240422) TaxID=1213857 RepID=N4VAV6_COLOR|nr:hypothetical protein Cob_v003031 [Colletotrichum orbiculare MAFF 240422]
MSDVFRKVGRGGAGNFFSKKDVEDAQKASPEDVEAQKDAATAATTSPTSATTNPSGYARAGRGGAGNFHETASLPDAKQQEEAAGKTQAAVNASLARSSRSGGGASGRGGAGNYGESAVPGAETTDEDVRKEALEKKIIEDVEAGLPMPPKTYYHPSAKENKQAA